MGKTEYESELLYSVLKSIETYGGNEFLSSVILTGSFGRGEPTYQIIDGQFELKSDVEIALVYSGKGAKKKTESLIKTVTEEFKEDLNLMALSQKRVCGVYNFNFSLRVPKYKTLFTYDLFNGSRTIWGEKYIETRSVTLGEVDIYEAKRILANRIGEFVYLTKEKRYEDYTVLQWKGKIVLAIVSAWLLVNKKYVSSYHGQRDVIQKNEKEIQKVFGENFLFNYYKTYEFLREAGRAFSVSDEHVKRYVRVIAECFNKERLSSSKVNSISRVCKYEVKYLKSGMKLGVCRFEDKILSGLIDSFVDDSKKLKNFADVWHKVLY